MKFRDMRPGIVGPESGKAGFLKFLDLPAKQGAVDFQGEGLGVGVEKFEHPGPKDVSGEFQGRFNVPVFSNSLGANRDPVGGFAPQSGQPKFVVSVHGVPEVAPC